MRCGLLLFVCSIAAFGQTAATPATPSVAIASLPAYTIGAGPSWTRGGTTPYALDVTVGVHVGQSQWYSWTDISTPIVTPCVSTLAVICPPSNALPVPSTITTGGAWVPVQSASGSVSLLFIIQAGFSNIVATSTIAPAFSGSFGVAFRLGASHVYILPYVKLSNASTSATSGALATAVLQPSVQIVFGFGGK
jgi:hypothetical protein